MLPVILDSSKVKRRSLYRWADFVELFCLNDPDGEAPLEETLREAWGFETGLASNFACQEEDDPNETDLERPEYEDKINTEIIDLLKHFQLREQLLGDAYPFTIDPNDLVLIKKPASDSHRLYIYILRAANLAFHTKEDEKALTTGFERIAYHVLEELMPPSAKVALFGTAGHNEYKCYPGNKYTKLCAFADEMGTRLDRENINEHTYAAQDTGDDGLDVAAWYPFNDKATHFPLFLAQAGCTASEKGMLDKQFEVDAHSWGQRIRQIWPLSMMVTPQCYRQANGRWEQPAKIVTVFIDRIRIMILLRTKAGEFTDKKLPLYSEAV